MRPWCPLPPTRAGRAQTFPSVRRLLLLIKIEGLGEEAGKRAKARERRLSSSESWDWQWKVRGGERLRCGRKEGAATRVMSVGVPAPTVLLLAVSEC